MTDSSEAGTGSGPRRAGRTTTTVTAVVVALFVALTAILVQSPANSAFSAPTTDTGNRVGSGTIAPVTGLTATVRCSSTPAPTYLSTTYNTASSGGTTVRLAVPSGTWSGDLIVVHIERNSTTAPTAPAGFSTIRSDTASGIDSWVYERVATASDAGLSYTWTVSGTSGSGVLSTFRGAAGITLATETAGQAISTATNTAEMPSVTAGVANSLLVFFIGAQSTTASSTSPGGMTSRYQTVSGNAAFYGFTEVRTAAGATAVRAANLSTSSPLAVAGLLIRPALVVDLAWTPSASTAASGYEVRRDGAVLATLAGRTTAAWTDGTAPSGTHTWTLFTTTSSSWRSSPASVTTTVSC
jgi:hypothetical protein